MAIGRMKKVEVTELLKARGVKFDFNSPYNDLCKLLTDSVPVGINPVAQTRPEKSLEVEALEAKNQRLKDQMAEMKKPKGIASVINKEGKIKRPDEVYQEAMPSALGKASPEELTPAEVNAIERELRKFIARRGGYRKGLSEELKERCQKLMKIAGRTELVWDLGIDIPGFTITTTQKEKK